MQAIFFFTKKNSILAHVILLNFWHKTEDFVHRELTGWLWFAIGQSHVSDRLSRPCASKRVIGEEMLLQEGKEVILIKDHECT